MRIGLITPRPDHPLLAATTALLTRDHQVEWTDPDAPSSGAATGPPADVYLLKARTPHALALARDFEERGASVLNSAAATGLCQDRTAMAALARRAGLPFAATRTAATIADLMAERGLGYPLVVKSRHSRRSDLVARIDDPVALLALAASWPDEPVVVQEFTANSGWDQKLWVIDGQVFAAPRRSELAAAGPDPAPAPPLTLGDPPGDRLDLARRVGAVFALDVYGVDVIETADGSPLIVDVNAFPGVRGQAGAPEALAGLALRAAGRARAAC